LLKKHCRWEEENPAPHPTSALESWQSQVFHLPLSNQPAANSYTRELQKIKMEEGETQSMSRHKSFVKALKTKILMEFC